jgi:hypothetical protein
MRLKKQAVRELQLRAYRLLDATHRSAHSARLTSGAAGSNGEQAWRSIRPIADVRPEQRAISLRGEP